MKLLIAAIQGETFEGTFTVIYLSVLDPLKDRPFAFLERHKFRICTIESLNRPREGRGERFTATDVEIGERRELSCRHGSRYCFCSPESSF